MADYTLYKFETHDGLPPDGEPGQFFGFDGAGRAFVMRWTTLEPGPGWQAIGFSEWGIPIMHRWAQGIPDPDSPPKIVRWARAPVTNDEILSSIAGK